jgi:hypothetical protein
MKLFSSRWIALAATVAALGLSTSAHAVWTFDAAGVTGIAATSGVAGDPNVSLTGFAVQNAGYTGATGTGVSGGFNSGANGNWTANSLAYFAGNGQGMYSGTDTGTPYHALDNNGTTEGVLLSFGSSVVLNSVGLGYTANTAGTAGPVDLSVFRWTGGSAPGLAGTAASTMAGWELVGNYGDMVTDTTNPYNLVNGSGKGSSWWLITAYNSGFTQSAGAENRSTLDNGNDFFKLYAVAGTQCTSKVAGVCGPGTTGKLPEPTSLALTSVALLGVAGLRRRRQAKQA